MVHWLERRKLQLADLDEKVVGLFINARQHEGVFVGGSDTPPAALSSIYGRKASSRLLKCTRRSHRSPSWKAAMRVICESSEGSRWPPWTSIDASYVALSSSVLATGRCW